MLVLRLTLVLLTLVLRTLLVRASARLLLACACAPPPPARAPPPPPPPACPPPRPAASATGANARLPKTKTARNTRSEVFNELVMCGLPYFVLRATISIFFDPAGGLNLKVASLRAGFRFQSMNETD